jgi:hypothetical protein
MTKSDLVDLVVIIRKETDLAILVWNPEGKPFTVWLPKSQIEIARDDPMPGRATITAPSWLLQDKELI